MGTITSADNGGYYPDANGFQSGGDWICSILGGTTINAQIQIKTVNGNWLVLPQSEATITGAVDIPIVSKRNTWFRIYVISATGTWDVDVSAID